VRSAAQGKQEDGHDARRSITIFSTLKRLEPLGYLRAYLSNLRTFGVANQVSEACRSRYPSQASLLSKGARSGQAPGTEISPLTGDVDHLDVIPKSLPDQLGQLSFSYWCLSFLTLAQSPSTPQMGHFPAAK
jgi:hypothetical protein